MNTHFKLTYIFLFVVLFASANNTYAQSTQPLSLPQAIEAASNNNHLLKIKNLQVEEKKSKLKEDEIKRYPSVMVNSLYQYNVNVGELIVPPGAIGVVPVNENTMVPLPNEPKTIEMGTHHVFTAGASLYQPLTQQGKISTGSKIAKTDVMIAEREKEKVAQQLSQEVEKVYFGLLINQKRQQEAKARLELVKIKVYDIESALAARKTNDATIVGLQASMADEEQNLLKLQIEEEDYLAELRHLTGLSADRFDLQEVEVQPDTLTLLDQYLSSASSSNLDMQLTKLSQTKSELAIKAAKQSFLPNIGILAGYAYQRNLIIFPENNIFAGVGLTWNLQDQFANKQVLKQRNLMLQQAKENIANTEEQVTKDIEKAYRKLSQAKALITVAQRAVQFRKEEMKIQQDRRAAGLNTEADVLNTQSVLAKSKADLYAAQLNYKLAQSDLRMLAEGK